MIAAVLHGREDLRIEEVEPPALHPGEVRVSIQAALTCGTDFKVYKRGYHARMISPPALFGHELAGAISELGPGVNGWQVGDRVVAANSAPCGLCSFCRRDQENLCDDLLFLNGAYAESIVVPQRLVEKNLLRLRPGTRFADAALVEPLACVVHGIEDCRLQPGQHVLIIGSGPIGLMFAALAKHLGCTVTVAGRGTERLETARRLEVDDLIDMTGKENLVAEVNAGEKARYDVVIEAVGRPELWEAAVQLVRKGGLVNFFGGCPSGTNVSLDTGLIHYSNLTLLGSFHHTPRTIRRALQWIEDGVIQSSLFINGECGLRELPDVFRSMKTGNRTVKTLVKMPHSPR